MQIIINKSSMVPIYEQIADQIKHQINTGSLKPQEALPSVRALAKELDISALTVKKAYDFLEKEGITTTVHGKGTYINLEDTAALTDAQKKEVAEKFAQAVAKGRHYEMTDKELIALLHTVLER